jgi:hypothetical protein
MSNLVITHLMAFRTRVRILCESQNGEKCVLNAFVILRCVEIQDSVNEMRFCEETCYD